MSPRALLQNQQPNGIIAFGWCCAYNKRHLGFCSLLLLPPPPPQTNHFHYFVPLSFITIFTLTAITHPLSLIHPFFCSPATVSHMHIITLLQTRSSCVGTILGAFNSLSKDSTGGHPYCSMSWNKMSVNFSHSGDKTKITYLDWRQSETTHL